MAFLMTAAEALTEEINNIGNIDTSETMENLEKLKDVDPNKVVEYFKGKIPDFISFGMTVLLALVIYFIGSRLIKLLRRIVRRSLEQCPGGYRRGTVRRCAGESHCLCGAASDHHFSVWH